MAIWHNTIAVFGNVALVLRAVVVTVCMNVDGVVLLSANGAGTNRMPHGGHHCSQSWLLCQSGIVIRPILAYVTCTSVKLDSFACLTMSNLPTKFHSRRVIPLGEEFNNSQ